MTTTISPSLGHGAPFTQLGVGTSPGFDAIDLRRSDGAGLVEACMSMGSYVVSQRAAGANMSVDIAASTGPGVVVQGDAVTQQGNYVIPPHSAIINEAIATADATNPRIDSVILEVKDSTHDASGLNQAQTRVLTGTPTAAVTAEAPGASPAALPNSAILLAYVQVDAAASSITTAKIKDMRPKRRGFVHTDGSESTTATTYAYNNLTTPDRVTRVVLPTDGLFVIRFQGLWRNTVANNARIALFLNTTQVKIGPDAGGTTVVDETVGPSATGADAYIHTAPQGFNGSSGSAAAEVTTGQIVGHEVDGRSGPLEVFAAAGTYDISVQFKNNAAGTLTVSKRHLWVEAIDFDKGQLP